jgi:hypothetical protein
MIMQHRQTLSEPPFTRLTGRQAARDILLRCITAAISPEAKERLSSIIAGNVDWQYLLELTELHSITALIAHNLISHDFHGQIPKLYLDKLNQSYNANLYKNIIYSAELANILSVFNKHGLLVIPLKGTVLAELLFENPALRTIVDIDILVKPEALSQARSLLIEMGYQQLIAPPKQTPHPFHGAPYYKEVSFPIFLELHWNLADEKLLSVSMEDVWCRARPLKLSWGSPLVLSPEDTFLYMATKLSQEVSGLKMLIDIAEVLKKYENTLDWNYIIESAHHWQIKPAIYFALKRAEDMFGAPVPRDSFPRVKPGIWRWWVLDFLANRDIITMPIRGEKLREETMALTHTLMMQHLHQALIVLSKYRGSERRVPWLRTCLWMIVVLIAALGRNIARATLRRFL